MDENIKLSSIEALKNKLNQDEVIIRYRELGVKVHQNKELLALYNRYLQLQKEMVNLDYYKKNDNQKEKEFKALEARLMDNPLFNEYIQLQIELEGLFQTMSYLIEEGINTAIN